MLKNDINFRSMNCDSCSCNNCDCVCCDCCRCYRAEYAEKDWDDYYKQNCEDDIFN